MKRSHILFPLLRFPLDILTVTIGFFLARNIRSLTDGIPGVYLPVQNIPFFDFLIYLTFGIFLFLIVQESRTMYRREFTHQIQDEIIIFLGNSFIWFLIFIGCLYLSLGFTTLHELPRLIIVFALILHVLFGIIGRILLASIEKKMIAWRLLPRERLLLIGKMIPTIQEKTLFEITQKHENDPSILEEVRNRNYDTIFLSGETKDKAITRELVHLSRIYGVRCIEAVMPGEFAHIPREVIEWNGVPVIRFSAVTITPMERLVKRILDIILSGIVLILLSPIFLVIALLIYLDDPSGPIIFRNRRVGLSGNHFTLYKFRYMYWKYCVKDAYGKEDDEALRYEAELREKQSSREGPVYKIADDPRKTRVGTIIEKFSLDELPQLINVLIGNMSLVGPRAHQPREVEHYEEYQNQVLTVKPGITGMAQVHGRDENSFADEVKLDVYYIEHYSLWLDLMILIQTFGVILKRGIFGK